ncbi:MAG: hypothetical protein AAGM16_07765 [Pseudomonadota bacterium]
MSKRILAAGLVCSLALLAAASTAGDPPDRAYPAKMVRTKADETPFQSFFPGISVYPLYGTFEGPGPHSVIVRNDPAIAEEVAHTHTNGYWAVVVSGRLMHWELSEPDRGPILTAGASWFQPGGVPHADLCLGPEVCITVINWLDEGDFKPVE